MLKNIEYLNIIYYIIEYVGTYSDIYYIQPYRYIVVQDLGVYFEYIFK